MFLTKRYCNSMQRRRTMFVCQCYANNWGINTKHSVGLNICLAAIKKRKKNINVIMEYILNCINSNPIWALLISSMYIHFLEISLFQKKIKFHCCVTLLRGLFSFLFLSSGLYYCEIIKQSTNSNIKPYSDVQL